MEINDYKEFITNSDTEGSKIENNTWKPLLRQCVVCSGVWYIYFMHGLYLGAPTVLIAQIRREANSTQAVTDEMSSWLSSTPAISSLPLMFIFSWLFHRIGRKFTYLITCVICIIGYILFYISTTFDHIIISQIFLGASFAATNSFSPILIAEYTSPKYRGIFLTLKSVLPFWGIWISNIIGTFFHWKNIALVSFVFAMYVTTVLTWPESPLWLARRGRYSECAKSHRFLKGCDVNSEKELAQLILSHKRSRNKCNTFGDTGNTIFLRFSAMWSTVTSRSFYKPSMICVIIFAQYQLTGKFVIAIYAIDVIKNMTQDESVAYKGMLILDAITVFSMYCGCVLSGYFKRKVLLLSFASIGNILLYILSFYLYFISLSFVQENHFVIIFLLSIFSIATGCGPMILASSIYGEIVPIQHQSPIMVIVGISTISIISLLLKLSPLMFKVLKMHGCLLFFALSSTFIIIVLYIYLPETKDKTIQEISDYFTEKSIPEQQNKLLLEKVIK